MLTGKHNILTEGFVQFSWKMLPYLVQIRENIFLRVFSNFVFINDFNMTQ